MNRDPSITDLGTRAIDVGYFNVKYTLGRKKVEENWPIATGLFPAMAPRLATSSPGDTLGTNRLDGFVVEADGVNYFVGRDFSFSSTGVEPRPIADGYCTTAKYLAQLRGALQYMAQDAGAGPEVLVRHLVVALPLNTFPKYKTALAARVQGEHLVPLAGGAMRRITVERVSVIVQPHGALLNFGSTARGQLDGWTLVIDPGGGTLDWYVASKDRPNWPRSGAYPKAMLACAYAVADKVEPAWRDQHEIISRIDTAIRQGDPVFKVGAREYALSQFQSTIDAVLEESIEKMFTKVGPIGDIGQILLTGGGATVFHRFLEQRRPDLKALLRIDADPVFSNVRGFHIYGELMQQPAGGAR